jgi:uncharacterized membrane protein
MQVQMKKLYVYQYLLFAAIQNWLRLSSHDVIFATVESAAAPRLCVWNFGKYTSTYKVTHVLIDWLVEKLIFRKAVHEHCMLQL